MKCIVIYFSQTVNTEKVTYAIQRGAKQAAGHCDIAKIKDANLIVIQIKNEELDIQGGTGS